MVPQTHFPPAVLDNASHGPVVINNSTRAWSANCCQERDAWLNVRMTFDVETTQNEAISQRLKLGWEETCPWNGISGYEVCELRDIDGERHPSCNLGQSVLQRPNERDWKAEGATYKAEGKDGIATGTQGSDGRGAEYIHTLIDDSIGSHMHKASI